MRVYIQLREEDVEFCACGMNERDELLNRCHGIRMRLKNSGCFDRELFSIHTSAKGAG